MLNNNSAKLSKMLINGTSLRSSHLLETESLLKYSLLHVLRINGALSHLLYPPFQVFNDGIWLNPSFLCVLQLFLHSRGKHQEYYYGKDFSDHSSFPMKFFALNCFTFSLTSRLQHYDGVNSLF